MPKQHREATRIFANPQDILESYLLDDETILYDDAPSLYAFLITQLPLLILVGAGAIASIVWAVKDDHPAVTGVILILLGLILAYLLIQRATQLYTRYVLTNFRVMRMTGFLKRQNAWIPWAKVTDVRYEATFIGRLFGFATLSIDSANELSGLKELKNLRDPARCELALIEAVRAKQSGKQVGPAPASGGGGGGGGGQHGSGPSGAPTPGPGTPHPAGSGSGVVVTDPSVRASQVSELSARLAELLAVGPVTVSISYPAGVDTSPTARHGVVVFEEDGDDDATAFDAALFD